jgi:hypothetical protein
MVREHRFEPGRVDLRSQPPSRDACSWPQMRKRFVRECGALAAKTDVTSQHTQHHTTNISITSACGQDGRVDVSNLA